MVWWVALDIGLYVAAIVTFFMGYGWYALVCIILAVLLTFILMAVAGGGSSGGSTFIWIDDFNIFD
jgi:hypothetical protein